MCRGHLPQGDADAATPASKEEAEYRIKDVRTDIFAFGLCMLELLTLKQLDPQHFADLRQLIEEVGDEEARTFIASCVGLAPLNGSSSAAESGSGAGECTCYASGLCSFGRAVCCW